MTETVFATAANITRPRTGPRSTSSLRFFMAFIGGPPSLVRLHRRRRGLAHRSFSGGGRARRACQPLALELSHIGDDRPPVGGRDRPFVPCHQPYAVRDDIEDLSVRILQDLLLVKRGGGDVASLEQDSPAVPLRVVARLAV